MASTTITSRNYVHLSYLYGAPTFGAPIVPATSLACLMHPQRSPMLPEHEPMSPNLPPPEPVPLVDLTSTNTSTSLPALPPLPNYHLASYNIESDPLEKISTAFSCIKGPRRGPHFIIMSIVPRGHESVDVVTLVLAATRVGCR